MFKRKNQFFIPGLLAVICFGGLSNAFAASPVGTVIVASGNVEAGGRKVSRGSKIFAGERIVTAAKSEVQIRFSDNGLISLKQNSVYRVDNYEFKGAGDKNAKQTSTLVKGKVLALTGAITQQNPKGYTLKSKLSTIGITGTELETEIPANEAYQIVDVFHGTVSFDCPGGTMPLGDNAIFRTGLVTEDMGIPVGISSPSNLDLDEHDQDIDQAADSDHSEDQASEEDLDNFALDNLAFTSFFDSFEPGLDEEFDANDLGEAEEDHLEDEEADEIEHGEFS